MSIVFFLMTAVGLGLYFSQSQSSKRPLFAGMGVLGALLLLLSRLIPSGAESIDYLNEYEEALGYQMARSLIASVPEAGTALYLLPQAANPEIQKRIDSLERGFLKGLKGSTWIPQAMNSEQLPADIPAFGASPQLFSEVLQRHPKAAAIISFVGLPALDPSQWPGKALLARENKFNRRIEPWISQGKAQAVICLLDNIDSSARPKGKDPEADFALRYRVLTP